MRRYMYLMGLASVLTACASGPTPTPAPIRVPPPHLLSRMPEALPAPASARGPDLLVNHVISARLYHWCRENHRSLADWVESGLPTGDGAK